MCKICLVGNPNCGKTTLFNTLTGSYQKVGNWSGVTTEKKEGVYKEDKTVEIVDLPGLYSMTALSKDELAVIDYLKDNKDATLINVIDGTNLERNLFLTVKLIQLGMPMIVAVNFYDEIQKNGIYIDFDALSKVLGVKILPISAKKGFNVDKLIRLSKQVTPPKISAVKRFGDKSSKAVYEFIDKNISRFINNKQTNSQKKTLKLDNFLMGRYTGIPFFLVVIFLIYLISSKVGGFFSDKIAYFFYKFSSNTALAMLNANLPKWFISLFADAVFKGVGTVLSFTPQILILFFLMGVVEESGYASRVTFLFDNLLRKVGLGGKSAIPLILSCGCTVTGIMASRTIETESEKTATLYLAPFMPCGAKMIVFAWLSYVFFNSSAWVSVSMYCISVVAIFIFGSLLKRFNKSKNVQTPFVLEMPTLRRPTLKNLFMVIWEKTKDFTVKSGSVILGVSVLTWLLMNFGLNGYVDGDVTKSMLYYFGSVLRYIFIPLGFGSWQASVSLISGVFAKEAVIETILLVESNYVSLFSSPINVYSFMIFVLLSPPCIASIVTVKKELKSNKKLFKMLAFQFVCAYVASFCVNLIGLILTQPFLLILCVTCVIITVVWAVLLLLKNVKKPCSNCNGANCRGKVCPLSTKRSTTI